MFFRPAFLITILTGAVAQADPVVSPGNLPIEAATLLGDATNVVPFGLVIFLLSFLGLGLWSNLARTGLGPLIAAGGPAVRNMFLKVQVRMPTYPAQGVARECVTHIRAMNLRSAVLVSPRFLARHERIMLRLDSMPGFPQRNAEVEAAVVSSRPIPGTPDTFELLVKWDPAGPSVSSGLRSYLEGLVTARPTAEGL